MLFFRVLSRIIGDDIESQLCPLLLSILSNLTALSILTTYFGPWLLFEVHASSRLVAQGFLFAGIIGAGAGLVGGWLIDRYSRKSVITVTGIVQIITTSIWLLPLPSKIPGLTACILFALVRGVQSIRGVGQQTLLADLSSAEKTAQAFTAFRLVLHCGLFSGPIIGALLLWSGWKYMFAGVMILNIISFLVIRTVKLTSQPALSSHESGVSTRDLWLILRESRFWMLFVATLSGWIVVYSYEISLPLQLMQIHVLSPQSWGYIFALGPILVIFLQLRIGKWFVKVSMRLRIILGSTLMATAFLLLLWNVTPVYLIAVTVIFIAGDMLWGPTGDNILISVAPERFRGIYMGINTMGMWLGSAIAPLIDLAIQTQYGFGMEIMGIAILSLLSASFYILSFYEPHTVPRR